MEQLKDCGKDRTAFGVLCFLVTSVFLTFVDIVCVGAYFGLIVWLLYFTFLKDGLEILTFAIVKCVARLEWLCKIFKISELLYINTENNVSKSNIEGNSHDTVDIPQNTCLVQNCTSQDHPSSGSSTSKSTFNLSKFIGYSPSQSEDTLQTAETRSPVLFQSPLSSKSEDTMPRKLSSLSTNITSSTDNFYIASSTEKLNIDETNFEDVDLSDEKIERDLVTPPEESIFKRSSLRWNFNKIKLFDSFRKNKSDSPVNVKTRLENLTAKIVTDALYHREDNEKLISDKKDSPEQVGCCTSLPHLLKAKYQNSIAHYAQF